MLDTPTAKERRAPPLVQRREGEVIFVVEPAETVTVELAAIIFGLSEGAIRKRIATGIWLEGKHWTKSPDGRIWIFKSEVVKWVKGTE